MSFFIQRLISSAAVLWLAVTLAFFALRVLPGDAIRTQLIDSGATEAIIAERQAEYGLDQPLIVQYGDYLSALLRGDMGISLLSGYPVHTLIAQQFLPTLSLAIAALAIALLLGLLLGGLASWPTRRTVARPAQAIIGLALSTPIYWTGTLAIYIFSVQLNLLPSGGAGRLSHLILPALVLGFHTAGSIARVIQGAIEENRQADFIRTARAKGLSEVHILYRHVLITAMLPLITVVALQAGFLLSGAVITESLFARPGLGRLLVDAVLRQDYPVVQGVVVVAAGVYVMINTLADLCYHLFDPRVELV